ncbi:MAG TPA: helix-turn-helix domain-containing protein [Pyrinomonadaceae bacterium]|nr:helix-turn-helix domain-containing protein [Pyrinomonadaceae bacterium]
MPYDFLNPRSILVFICMLQGVIFAALLLRRGVRERSSSDKWLAALVLVLSATLITPFIGFANVYDNNQWLTYFPFAILYTYGVFVWLYTVTLTDAKRTFSSRELLLFLPAAIYLVYRFFLFSHSVEWKTEFDRNYGDTSAAVIFVTELAWNMTFLFLAIRHYRKYRAWLDENYSDTERIKFDWLRNFLYLFTAVAVFRAAFDLTNSFVTPLSYIQFFYFEVVLAISTYYLAVSGYIRSRNIEINFVSVAEISTEEKRALLSNDELRRQSERLEQLLVSERPYLEPSLTLTELSRMLGVNTTVLSYVINQSQGCNFNDLINRYRVEAVKAELAKGSDEQLLTIALDSGFNSKATFNRAFKKFTGLSPSEYQENTSEIG